MPSTRISLRQVLDLHVPMTWQEAVAVAHEVAILSVVVTSKTAKPPRIDAESCFLTRRGDVELPESTDVEQPDAVLQILRELLTGREIPDGLEAVAYGGEATHLSDDLAMFSRPNRRTEIAALALRAIAAEAELGDAAAGDHTVPVPETTPRVPPLPVGDEFARLREQAAQYAVSPVSAAEQPRPRITLRVAAGTAALLVVTAGWALWYTSPPNPPDAPAAMMPGALRHIELDPSWGSVGLRAGDISLDRRPVLAAANSPSGVAPRPATTSLAAAVPTAVATTRSPNGATPAVEPDVLATEGVDDLFDDGSVYSWTSHEVEPPQMRFPRMPRSAFPPPEQDVAGPYFEVLVDQTGGVEAVRLHGREAPGQTFYRHRMMLAAAKAWQFAPARLDGRPVRYVVRVVIEP